MYLRYIYKLHDLHLSAENYAEAGFTLLLHTEMLCWSGDNLPPDNNYPAQTEMERKEAIYLKVIKYFDQGKIWEKGIPLCKELASLYEFKLYDYGKLSHVLKTQATFFENVMTQLRPEPEYFRVGFFGRGFPLFVRVSQ
jgi:dedicator of cytokinesis protein 3